MTEINDHLKLLFARAASLYCRQCGELVRRDTPETIFAEIDKRAKAAGDPRVVITFPVDVPKNFTEEEVTKLLQGQGYSASTIARARARGHAGSREDGKCREGTRGGGD